MSFHPPPSPPASPPLSIDALAHKSDLKDSYAQLEQENIELFHLVESLQKQVARQADSLQSIENPSIDEILDSLHDNSQLYRLYSLTSWKEKEILLSSACQRESPELILTIVEYLESSLEPRLFLKLLKQFPYSLNHYIYSLWGKAGKSVEIHMKLSHLYTMIGKHEESAFHQIQAALYTKEPTLAQMKLKKCAEEYENSSYPSGNFIYRQLQDAADLLERQMIIQQFDQIEEEKRKNTPPPPEKRRNTAVNNSPPVEQKNSFSPVSSSSQSSFIGSSLSSTVRHCLNSYDSSLPETHFASPVGLKKHFHMTEATYLWLAMESQVKKRDFHQLKALIPKESTWFGLSSQYKSPIGFEPFLQLLKESDGPLEIKEYFCSLIADKEEKYKMSIKYHLFEYSLQWIQQYKRYDRLQALQEEIQRVLGNSSQRGKQLKQTMDIVMKEISSGGGNGKTIGKFLPYK